MFLLGRHNGFTASPQRTRSDGEVRDRWQPRRGQSPPAQIPPLLLCIPALVVLDTSDYDSVQVHYRLVGSHVRVFLRQIPLAIHHVSPVLEIVLVHLHDFCVRPPRRPGAGYRAGACADRSRVRVRDKRSRLVVGAAPLALTCRQPVQIRYASTVRDARLSALRLAPRQLR